MKSKIIKLGLVTLLVISQTISGFSQEKIGNSWTQFRGPNRNGISSAELSKLDWSEKQPELIWRKEIGSGFSELIVSDNVIYTMDSEQIDSVTGSEYIAAFNETNGEEIWRTRVDSIFIDIDGWGNGPSSTPTIDEDKVYSFSSFGKLTANSKKDGKLIWQVDFAKEFGSVTARWGDASSPIIVDEMIIMEAGGTDSRGFIAFNKIDGKVVWANGDGEAHYNSPLLVTIDGKQQLIFTNRNILFSFNLKGDTIWTYQLPFSYIKSMPVLVGTDKIFLSGVRNPGFVIVQIKDNKATKVLDGSSMKNDYSSSCYKDGYLYGFHVAAFRCISAETGEVSWTKRGMGKGSLILIDDNLLVLSDQGKLAIVDATPDAYTEKSATQVINGKSWTAPSFANGKLYVRNLTEMACYKLN
jgi:outer membrane protein assembly factor BamB